MSLFLPLLILLPLFGSLAFFLSLIPRPSDGTGDEENAEGDAGLCAHVFCSGSPKEKYRYDLVSDCRVAASLDGGHKWCRAGCTGLGNCTRACPYGAISIKGGVAKVDRAKCRGCGKCAEACPKALIRLIPREARFAVSCSSTHKGAEVIRICDSGCIGCKICENTCPEGAVNTAAGFARIRPETCTSCGKCAAVCPRSIIETLS